MNNNIIEKYVTFEIGNLLKEKGFNVPTREYYRNYPTAKIMSWDIGKYYNGNDDSKMETAGGMTYVSAPTTALTISWIRENFGIQIFLDYTFYDGFHYGCQVVSPNGNVNEIWIERKDLDIDGADTPQEAENAAIHYTLTNLI